MNLYQKLHTIQKACHGLGRDAKTYSYQYVTGSKVLSVVRPLMDDLGLLLKQEITDLTNVRQDYTIAGKNDNPDRIKSEVLSSAKMRFTWVDIESGETDVNEFYGNGQNDWDKGVGSALTYAERYFLLKYFHISTDSDDCDYLSGLREKEEAERQEAAKKAAEEVKKPKPITEKAFSSALNRLTKGEAGLLEKLLSAYVLTDEQKETFVSAARNANRSTENKS